MMRKKRGNELYFSLEKLCSTLIATTIKCLCVKNNSESSYGREKMISFFLSNDGWRERRKESDGEMSSQSEKGRGLRFDADS